jgi:hypothetical protein
MEAQACLSVLFLYCTDATNTIPDKRLLLMNAMRCGCVIFLYIRLISSWQRTQRARVS